MVRKEKRKNKLESLRSAFLFQLKNKTEQNKAKAAVLLWPDTRPDTTLSPHQKTPKPGEKPISAASLELTQFSQQQKPQSLALEEGAPLPPAHCFWKQSRETEHTLTNILSQSNVFQGFPWFIHSVQMKDAELCMERESYWQKEFLRIPLDKGDKTPAICEPQADINSPTEWRFYRLRINAPALYLNEMITQPKKKEQCWQESNPTSQTQPQKPNSISPFQEKTWQFPSTYRLLPGFKHKYQHRAWTKYPQFIKWMATRLRVSFEISPLQMPGVSHTLQIKCSIKQQFQTPAPVSAPRSHCIQWCTGAGCTSSSLPPGPKFNHPLQQPQS